MTDAVPAPTVWPALRYDDAPGALRFLVDVLGFRESLVVPDDSGDITHAELHWPEGGAVMLGSTKYRGGAHARMSAGTTSVYVVSDHVDEVHQRCRAAGAQIVTGLEDTDYGSHTFTVGDLEGNLWTIGTYRGTP
ncbi:MAG TPA: VOC family protein [Pseudonocardia sp.]